MTRILSLSLPTLPTDRLAARLGLDPARPFATVAKVRGALRLAAVDRLAETLTLRPGMGLADARAVCPILQVADADPQGETDTLRRMLEWCRRFTPVAALDGVDGLLLDISGAAHLFGGEAALIAAAEAGLAHRGFAARGAVADTAEAAWALARFGETRLAPPGPAAIRALAEPLPLAALRLDPATLQTLVQTGLRRIGDVLIRPRAPITARFGAGLFARLDGLLGLTKTPIEPCFPVPDFLAERRYAAGLTQIEAIAAAIGALAGMLCEQLAGAGTGARRVEALFFRVDGVVRHLAVGTSRPLRNPADLVRLFAEKLSGLGEDGLDTGYGFDLIRLEATAVERLGTDQARLQPDPGSEAAREADLALLVDRLGARLGVTRVLRLRNANHHRPEDAATLVPAFRVADAEADESEEGQGSDRPLRLFDRPEPIATTAGVPDGPPVSFRWRRADHVIAAIEGPERIAAPWWTDRAPIRDYFQAEDGQGHRFWLFREGIYGATASPPQWFLHGLFG